MNGMQIPRLVVNVNFDEYVLNSDQGVGYDGYSVIDGVLYDRINLYGGMVESPTTLSILPCTRWIYNV